MNSQRAPYKKTAFITGASRGIGACSALALADAGYNLAISARSLTPGEAHDHGAQKEDSRPLPGSLEEVAAEARERGAEVLCLAADILKPETVCEALNTAIAHFGGLDLLFNNACYQARGNMARVAELAAEDLQAIYQGNVFTPLALVQAALPALLESRGNIINMVSGSALIDPPAPPESGGWGFGYASSKAALIRMAGSLRAEHPGDERGDKLKVFNIEPGFVVTEVMRANGLTDELAQNFKPTQPETIATVVRYLCCESEAAALQKHSVIHAPQLAKKLGL